MRIDLDHVNVLKQRSMDKVKSDNPQPKTEQATDRKGRLAEALRENLRKRKAQARLRERDESETDTPSPQTEHGPPA